MRILLAGAAAALAMGVAGHAGAQECVSDADCLTPLECRTYDDTDGVAQTNCVYAPAECGSDADCGEGYECFSTGGGEVCTTPECRPGETCSTQPVCETAPPLRFCFPRPDRCVRDSDCYADWSCVDFRAEFEESVPWWDWTVTIACVPDGITAALRGEAVLGGALADDSGGIYDPALAEPGMAGSVDAPPPGYEPQENTGSGSSRCSVGAAPSGGLEIAFGALLVALGWRRRSRSADHGTISPPSSSTRA